MLATSILNTWGMGEHLSRRAGIPTTGSSRSLRMPAPWRSLRAAFTPVGAPVSGHGGALWSGAATGGAPRFELPTPSRGHHGAGGARSESVLRRAGEILRAPAHHTASGGAITSPGQTHQGQHCAPAQHRRLRHATELAVWDRGGCHRLVTRTGGAISWCGTGHRVLCHGDAESGVYGAVDALRRGGHASVQAVQGGHTGKGGFVVSKVKMMLAVAHADRHMPPLPIGARWRGGLLRAAQPAERGGGVYTEA